MTESLRPLPAPDPDTLFYWEGARRHELVILRCATCGHYVHYPRPSCSTCAGTTLRPTPVSGRGVLYSYTITHYPAAPGFDDAVPFVVALVELHEQKGLRIIANLREWDPSDLAIGMPVEVIFEQVATETILPQVRPWRSV